MEKTPGGEPAAPNSCHVAQMPYAVCSSDSPPPPNILSEC